MKKTVSLLLSIVMCMCFLIIWMTQSKAAEKSLAEIQQLYPQGGHWIGRYSNASECHGFALMVADLFYGSGESRSSFSKTTDFNNIKAGDIIRHKNSSGKDGHTVWVTNVNGDDITVGECNWSKTDYCVISWTRHISKNTLSSGNGLYVLSAPYDMNGSINHAPQWNVEDVSGGKGCINIAGWVFDRDDLTKSLELNIYIGEGEECEIYGACANKEGTDVNDDFQCGNYHRFANTINTKLSGSQRVRLFAINIPEDGHNPLMYDGYVNIEKKEPISWWGVTNTSWETTDAANVSGTTLFWANDDSTAGERKAVVWVNRTKLGEAKKHGNASQNYFYYAFDTTTLKNGDYTFWFELYENKTLTKTISHTFTVNNPIDWWGTSNASGNDDYIQDNDNQVLSGVKRFWFNNNANASNGHVKIWIDDDVVVENGENTAWSATQNYYEFTFDTARLCNADYKTHVLWVNYYEGNTLKLQVKRNFTCNNEFAWWGVDNEGATGADYSINPTVSGEKRFWFYCPTNASGLTYSVWIDGEQRVDHASCDNSDWIKYQMNTALLSNGTHEIKATLYNGSTERTVTNHFTCLNEFAWWGTTALDHESFEDKSSVPTVWGSKMLWWHTPENASGWTYELWINNVKVADGLSVSNTWLSYTLDSTTLTNGEYPVKLKVTKGSETKTIETQILVANHYSTLTVDPNGGVWNGETEAVTYTGLQHTEKTIPYPQKEGYYFAGWSEDIKGGSLSWAPGAEAERTYTFGDTENAADTITAMWGCRHLYEYYVSQKPTCSTAGVLSRTCSRCGETSIYDSNIVDPSDATTASIRKDADDVWSEVTYYRLQQKSYSYWSEWIYDAMESDDKWDLEASSGASDYSGRVYHYYRYAPSRTSASGGSRTGSPDNMYIYDSNVPLTQTGFNTYLYQEGGQRFTVWRYQNAPQSNGKLYRRHYFDYRILSDWSEQQPSAPSSDFAVETKVMAVYQNEPVSTAHDYGEWQQNGSGEHIRVCKFNPAHYLTEAHTLVGSFYPASLTENGGVITTCAVCGYFQESQAIPMVSAVTLSADSFIYNGIAQRPAVTVKDAEEKTLLEGKDYTLAFSSGCKAPGTYKATVTLKGNYTGTVEKTFTITPQPIDASRITLAWITAPYNGAVQKPTVTVKNAAGNTMTLNSSYTVTYSSESKFPGTYTVAVKAKGTCYSGTVKKTYTVTRQPLNVSRVTLSWTSSPYNGAVQKPAVTITNVNGGVLTEGTHYTLAYSSTNKAPGTYKVTVAGKGNFSGSVTKSYTIAAQPLDASRITLSPATLTYNGAVQQPKVTVKNAAGNTMTLNSSYTLTYSTESKFPGKYTVTATGMGYYTGSVSKTYNISTQPLDASHVTLSWASMPYNGTVQKPTVTVTDMKGTWVLKEGTHYTVTYSSENKAPGTYTVTVKGKGNFTGTVEKTYTITRQQLDSSRVTLSASIFTYDGKVHKPTVTVKNAAGYVMTLNSSYTVSYSGDCKAKGTYTVTVTGKGYYEGAVTKTFTIK